MAERKALPFSPSQVKLIRAHLAESGDLRSMAMFSLAVDAELGADDVVSLGVADVWDKNKLFKKPMIFTGKARKRVSFRMCAYTRDALTRWIETEGKTLQDGLFTSGRTDRHLSTGAFRRMVEEWIAAVGLSPHDYDAHSVRRTRSSLVTSKTVNMKAAKKTAAFRKRKPGAYDAGED